jgi:hypothetical protein
MVEPTELVIVKAMLGLGVLLVNRGAEVSVHTHIDPLQSRTRK